MLVAAALACTVACAGTEGFGGLRLPGGASAPLTTQEVTAGLREALRVGTDRVVQRLGTTDGFNADPDVHIPLPDTLARVQSALREIGAAGLADDLELRLNRAAEAATQRAKAMFGDAVADMTLADALDIYHGPDDAATRYFRRTMTPQLVEAMRPVIEQSLAEVGALQAYERVMGRYRALPFVPDVKADLTQHAVEHTPEGIFLHLAREEAAIRRDPAERTTELLRRVFGQAAAHTG